MIQLLNKFYYVAALLVVSGILLKVTGNELAVPVMVTGSIAYAIVRIIVAVNNKDKKYSRIPLIHLVSAISLLVAAYLMYYASNSWAVFVFITAVLEIYASVRMDNKTSGAEKK